MTTVRKNLQLIYDRDHGTENYGWYTRCDEYDAETGEMRNGAVDESLGEGADYPRDEALDDACRIFGCGPSEIEVID
jgi:hypothetical protein